ncbi:bifunctional isochorismate lyase / aryl carrier protein/mycobactin phenyloxazoline synthetase [Nonomuraea solani]|uniref:Bifunctional isochorismate lyase / aryl carrier protein/mycobactin phenyloxazoline synthetase n=1 Tax=Nonomuraea solani TaxID=1144553 RepID=A0A1H6ETT4_9ACTN|nr:phosphopantetheine-binding protein [Nonomuraea solani]SEH01270.1 bifunctional isochorismate lyase / aryl carrier protein/mycobactin phenyloxazoline synthetase [Nonomuraea solani]
MSDSASAERLRAQIAELLDVEPGELGLHDDLVEAGLDSIRVMTLIEHWQREGHRIGFADLLEKPTIAAWAELFA